MRKILFLACCAVLAYGLFRPEPPPDLFEQSDKFLHVLAFAGLALVSRIAFPRVSGWLLWSLLFVQAPLLEWLQHRLQETREFSHQDILANLCGIGLALLLWLLHGLLRRRFFRPA
ncbi:VanZ family protein [Phytopseudomonas dryadis]|uniref:VanZ family protein n=1 Tax=Phytopseudomonas dryadis TaxID=2487520 RepID=A0A4V6MXB0_9GAMM|nr:MULTISPECIES: VanZ family protein [Pseudomonas]TBU95923.1 VanZ family protein [Pseudomonas dryadis]TBV09084.1 VanZ family protein [Pseudomonas dryadis]TBV18299.1 VanZ family protein [Pseudomonas sp. FRB 230]